MRVTLIALGLAFAVACAGQGYLSDTKPDPVSKPAGGDGGWVPLLQMFGAVMLVGAGVKYVLPKWLKAKPRVGSTAGELRIVESTPNGSGTYQVVEAGGRRYLVALTATTSTLLADISETPETPSFEDTLNQAPLTERVAAVGARLDEMIGR